ncbi:uncharacterized protein N7529_003888 [Penicillium soppii]|uniref:uncharacterized protein n=1 Tax=Penicillium soppii TaxID=69789 RepID=UPI002546EE84|nr:uncharacterized protein N7529_003888 [Penicillium soppii]KAJ5871535.1 hypothetical protein N7529_003888 [Penicillium soppii]
MSLFLFSIIVCHPFTVSSYHLNGACSTSTFHLQDLVYGKEQLAQAYRALQSTVEVQARIDAEITTVAQPGGVSTIVVNRKVCDCHNHGDDNRFNKFKKTGPIGKPGFEGMWVVSAEVITRNNLLTTNFCVPDPDFVDIKPEDANEWTDISDSE